VIYTEEEISRIRYVCSDCGSLMNHNETAALCPECGFCFDLRVSRAFARSEDRRLEQEKMTIEFRVVFFKTGCISIWDVEELKG
jgi:Zn finger protein HypA/HybF involved in hydrogenase expression